MSKIYVVQTGDFGCHETEIIGATTDYEVAKEIKRIYEKTEGYYDCRITVLNDIRSIDKKFKYIYCFDMCGCVKSVNVEYNPAEKKVDWASVNSSPIKEDSNIYVKVYAENKEIAYNNAKKRFDEFIVVAGEKDEEGKTIYGKIWEGVYDE